jgi:serine protease Do
MKRIASCGIVVLMLAWRIAASAAPMAQPIARSDERQHGGAGSGGGSGARSAPGYLGIDVRDVPEVEAPLLKLKDTRGAEIIRVDHDGPAGKMGLREHDVVLQMNGATIEGEDQIRRMLREIVPGRTVALTISRDGQRMMLTAQMADRTEVERQAWEQHLANPVGGGPQAPLTGLPSDDPASAGGRVPRPGRLRRRITARGSWGRYC